MREEGFYLSFHTIDDLDGQGLGQIGTSSQEPFRSPSWIAGTQDILLSFAAFPSPFKRELNQKQAAKLAHLWDANLAGGSFIHNADPNRQLLGLGE